MARSLTYNKPPKEYISHSQWTLWKRDPLEYYRNYYIGRNDYETDPMTLGKIFQKAWCDPRYDYETEFRSLGYTHDKARVVKTALEHPALIRPVGKEWETEYELTVKPSHKRAKEFKLIYPIMGIMDGYDGKTVLENKIGAPWNKQRVEDDTQLTWYALLIYIKYGFIPALKLQSVNSKHGIPTLYETSRTKKQLKELVEEINNMVTLLYKADFNQH